MKDMLLTYNEYNKDLGYVQGMSDLLAPIYAVMQDDAVAFWGFVGFMERMVSYGCLKSLPIEGTNHCVGAELSTRPIRDAQATHDARPPCTAHGP
jgi:hypothetical protein